MAVVSPWYFRLKRVIDLAICIAILPILAIVLAACAIAIRLDSPGPIVFTQLRTGRNGVRFPMYKFRTMVQNAEELKASLQHLNILPAPDFKIPNDPRITRVGGFLRKTSLDELPQILNVFRGDMSLVGPRPTSFHPSTYSLWHLQRAEVAPGITGLWQIGGRNELTFDERNRLDATYVRTLSIRQDFRIMLLTIGSIVRRSGH